MPARHRHHRRRAASCARTRHAVTLRSQAIMQLFAGNTPPEGLGHRVQRAARSSHRRGNIACAGALSSPAMPMRVIARRRCRAMVDTPEKTMFLQSTRSGSRRRVRTGMALSKRGSVRSAITNPWGLSGATPTGTMRPSCEGDVAIDQRDPVRGAGEGECGPVVMAPCVRRDDSGARGARSLTPVPQRARRPLPPACPCAGRA
jgi:hypothetical protein